MTDPLRLPMALTHSALLSGDLVMAKQAENFLPSDPSPWQISLTDFY